ncbi:MAG TPA: 3-deoxy-D-manno-octulosonic acid transferase [Geobacteraceae bacterium]|nr:3-deoxy-D-manno-octulosonic acid transferase [Geobacteraceae bacterium]
MILLVYEIAMWLAALFFIPYHFYRSVQRKRPPAFAERFGALALRDLAVLEGKRPIWVHAVSVGETIAVKPLLKALKEQFPDRKIVVSNVTETGRSVALKIDEADLCIYFPFDFSFAVRRILSCIRPSIILVVETEIWPNFLHTAHRMGIPAVMVNGRISDRSFGRYFLLGWFFRPILANFSWFCMQSGEDARRMVAMGAPADRVEVTGNLKYDLPVAAVSPLEKEHIRSAFLLPPDVLVFTAGSTHQGEDEALISAYRQLAAMGKKVLMVLVPRHPERAPLVAGLLKREKVACALRSGLNGRTKMLSAGEVLLVDTVGELTKFYAVSDIVFVGGSLVPTGGHNILEPASFRVPVIFGPHMSNFREAAEFILDCGGGLQVKGGEELGAVLGTLLDDPALRREMGGNGARLLEENSGSTGLHVKVVQRFLKGS